MDDCPGFLAWDVCDHIGISYMGLLGLIRE